MKIFESKAKAKEEVREEDDVKKEEEVKAKAAEETKAKNKDKDKVTILSSENLKFGIYWIDKGIKRTFSLKQFNKNKALCDNFDKKVKQGIVKIDR